MSNEQDTLLSAGKLSAKFRLREILASNLRFDHVSLSNGVFNLVNESDSTTNLSRILAGLKKTESDSVASAPQIFSENLKLNNFRFTLTNPFSGGRPKNSNYLVDFSNLAVSDIDVDIRDIQFQDNTLTAKIKGITFLEKSGFRLKRLSGDLTLNSNKTQVDNLLLSDGNSDIKANYFYMEYDSSVAFSDFVKRVRMGIEMKRSKLSFLTLGRFAEALIGNNLSVYLTGEIHGPVSNLRADNLEISSESGQTWIDVKARLSGLPNTQETMAFVDVVNSHSTINDLSSILYSLNGNNEMRFMRQFSSFVNFSFQGRLAGLLNDFVANGTLNSSIGDVYMDVLLRGNENEKGIEVIGNLKPESFNVGALLGNSSLGELTMNTTMSAILKDDTPERNIYMIDSLRISKLEMMGYTYQNIVATGSYIDHTFDGKVIIRDPNLDLLFQGIVGLSAKEDSYFNFYSEVIYADLKALNINKRDSVSTVSLQALANFTKTPNGDIDGDINMGNIFFSNEMGRFSLGNIMIKSTRGGSGFNTEFRSDFADANYKGSYFMSDFVNKLLNISLHSNLNALFADEWGGNEEEDRESRPEYYDLDINFKDTRYAAMFLLPELLIANNSTIELNINSDDRLDLKLRSKRLGYKNVYADNLNLDIKGDLSSIATTVLSDVISVNGIGIDSTSVFLNIDDNRIDIKTEYKNKSRLANLLDFTSSLEFTRISPEESPIVDLKIDSSVIYLNGQDWHFDRSRIVKQDSTYVFYGVSLFSDEQSLGIDGIVSLNPLDTLSATLDNMDLSFINSLFEKSPGLAGHFTGYANAVNLYKEPQVLLDVEGKKVELFNKGIEDIDIISKWDNLHRRFGLDLKNQKEGREVLSVDGYYNPSENYLHLAAKADSLNVNIFESFLSDIYHSSSGTLSGDLLLAGPLNALNLTSSNTRLNNMALTVDYTKVPYTLNGPVALTDKGVSFNNIEIKDRTGNSGRITGGLEYTNFKNLRLNTAITFNNLEVINLRESDNPNFYGRAFASGRMSISGPVKKILMDISVTSNRNSRVYIPVSNNEISKSNILTFTPVITHSNPEEPDIWQLPALKKEQKTPSELEIKLAINVTPDAAIVIEIDKATGDAITGYGTGFISMDINPSKDIFNIRGDYNIQSGFYKFVLQGVLERDFTIREGGNIRFNGDIMRTDLNLTAVYTTKASINTLLSESSSQGTGSIRRDVNCIIGMSGALLNPRLDFDIDITDINMLTKSRVDAALNTEDKIVTQVVALLVTGSFIPEIQSSIVNNSASILYSNATELLSNQINRILYRLDIPLDFNFNYAQGINGREVFDAAISTQIFNNKLVINGAIGNSDYKASNVVVGNLDLELKIDDKGRFRAKAFTRSADSYSGYLDNLDNNSTQRTGVGMVYQEEFSSFRELFNRIFRRKNRNKNVETSDSAATIDEPVKQ